MKIPYIIIKIYVFVWKINFIYELTVSLKSSCFESKFLVNNIIENKFFIFFLDFNKNGFSFLKEKRLFLQHQGTT